MAKASGQRGGIVRRVQILLGKVYRGGRGETRRFSRPVDFSMPNETVNGQSCLVAYKGRRVEDGFFSWTGSDFPHSSALFLFT